LRARKQEDGAVEVAAKIRGADCEQQSGIVKSYRGAEEAAARTIAQKGRRVDQLQRSWREHLLLDELATAA